ncbi:MAG: beta-N-acetylhexosaminidase [Spirochaetales bacterium]|nr:beta-N-acetylhexosaminidase [Spirochaetales bacterium]
MTECDRSLGLIPSPKSVTMHDGTWHLPRDVAIVWDRRWTPVDTPLVFRLARRLRDVVGIAPEVTARFGTTESSAGTITLVPDEAAEDTQRYTLSISPRGVTISGRSAALAYGAQTLIQLVQHFGLELPCCHIDDWPTFDERGILLDVTRGRIPTMEMLKRAVDEATALKYNQLQLYIEHSFAFSFLTELHGGEDALTAAEILQLDAYCRDHHVELVPCLASFGHLYMVLSTRTWQHVCEREGSADEPFSFIDRQGRHTLDISNPESLALLRKMFGEFLPLFTSRRFNICGDETFDLGTGRSRDMVASRGPGEAYLEFVLQVMDLSREFGFQPMLFGDILIRHPDLIPRLPGDAILLDWDYSPRPDPAERTLFEGSPHAHYTVPAVAGWNRLINNYDDAWSNITAMSRAGRDTGARGILVTHWGDYGHTAPLLMSLPAFAMGSCGAWAHGEDFTPREILTQWAALRYGGDFAWIGRLLHEAGSADIFTVRELVRYLERNEVTEIKEHPPQNVARIYRACMTAEQRLLRAVQWTAGAAREELEEMAVMFHGTALLTAVYAPMCTYAMDRNQPELIPPADLAIRIERWLTRYVTAWRRTDRESELRRVLDLLHRLCATLRMWNDQGRRDTGP